MAILDKMVDSVESILTYLARYMVGKDLASYCELCNAVGLTDDDIKRHPDLNAPYILVDDKNAMLTVFDLQGTYEILSDEEFLQMIDVLRIKMNGYLQRYGHSLTIGFERDPSRGEDELMRLAEPQIITAKRIGLDSRDIIIDRVKRNAPYVAWEQNLLVIYTHLNVLNPDELKREIKDLSKELIKNKVPGTMFGQNPATILMALKSRHDTMIERIKKDLERSGANGRLGVMLEPIDGHDAIRRIRTMFDRENTSYKFKGVITGDKVIPHGREDKNDCSDLTLPLIKYQIVTNNVETQGQLIKTTDYYHGVLSMELGPQEPQPFSTLFASIDRDLPWRCRIDINPGALNEMRGRQMASSIVGMFPANKVIRESFLYLSEESKSNAICSMKMTFSTWSTSEKETKRYMGSLEKAIQAWGVCQVTSVHGDPLAAWVSTIPGFTSKNVANRMAPPLPDALALCPFQRPATPWWNNGSLIVRTPDGKIYPIQLGSRLQDTWLELIAAPPGGGKSVFANSMNNATVHRSGNTRLPLMTIVDVGPSSSGLISLIQDSLPEHRKHEALYLRLQNHEKYSVNPCDTQLGARYPTQKESEFIENFFTLFCTDPAKGEAPNGCAQVISQLVKITYAERAGQQAHLYESQVEPIIDNLLEKSEIKSKHPESWWNDATWWEITDLLFKAGYIPEAAIAQRQAVPVMPDYIAALSNEVIRTTFGKVHVEGTGEPLLSYIARCLNTAMSSYVLFSGRTRFTLNSETRVISIDLNDVLGAKTREGAIKTAAMYMFARQLAAKNYFLSEEVVLPVIPQQYTEYHMARIRDVQDEQKSIIYDEFHNTEGQKSFVETTVKDAREGRKWGIRIVIISQYLADYPQSLLNAATAVYMMSGNSIDDQKILRESFNVSEEAIRRLQREATGPSAEGGNFLALFKTKVGTVVQLLTNTVGPIELWAFSTTLEDVSLRNRLYKRLSPPVARKLLAEEFPTGSAMKVIEKMRLEKDDSDENSVIDILANKLVEKFNFNN